jgi:O-antigen/teichoic acid export membrane protein
VSDAQPSPSAASTTEQERDPAGHRDVRNSVLYIASVFGSNLIPLITLPIFTRILTPHDYGLLALATVYAAFAVGIAHLGLTIGYEREFFAAPSEEEAGNLLFTVFAFVLTNLLLVGFLTWFFRDALSRAVIREPGHDGLLLATFAAWAVQGVRQYPLTYYRNRFDARSHVVVSLAEAGVGALFSILFVWWARIGVAGIPLGQLVGSGVVLSVVVARLGSRVRPRFDGAALSRALGVGLPLTPRVVLSVAGGHLDKYLIGLLSSLGGAGVYAVGQRISYAVFSYGTALENAYSPRVYRMMFERGESGGAAIGKYLTPFAYFSAGVAIAVALFGEEALLILTPAEYRGAAPIVTLLALYYASFFFAKQKELAYAKKTSHLPLLMAAGVAMNAAFNVVLIRVWGAVGAAAGTTIAGILGVCLTVVAARRYYRIRYEVGKMAAIFGLVGLAAAMTILLQGLGVSYGWRLAFKLAFGAAYLALGRRLGILSRQGFGGLRRALMPDRSPEPVAAGN